MGAIGLEFRPTLHDRGGRHPGRPFGHVPDCRRAGPAISFGAGGDAIDESPARRQDEIKVLGAGIDHDRARRFAGRIGDPVARDRNVAPHPAAPRAIISLSRCDNCGIGHGRPDQRAALAPAQQSAPQQHRGNRQRFQSHRCLARFPCQVPLSISPPSLSDGWRRTASRPHYGVNAIETTNCEPPNSAIIVPPDRKQLTSVSPTATRGFRATPNRARSAASGALARRSARVYKAATLRIDGVVGV